MATATKCVVIPSVAVSMFTTDKVTITFHKETWDSFISALGMCEKIVNFVRHKPTVELIESTLKRKMETGFEYRIGADTIFIVGLRTRTPVSGADVTATPDDLLIYRATVL
jgi:hypothetical protein